jgi:hypothetical protein
VTNNTNHMKKLALFLVVTTATFTSCKKDDWEYKPRIGDKFNYDRDGLKWLKKPDGRIPTNPFTVDSIAEGRYQGYNGYWCTSANGLPYIIDPVVIKKGRL